MAVAEAAPIQLAGPPDGLEESAFDRLGSHLEVSLYFDFVEVDGRHWATARSYDIEDFL